MLVSNLAVIVRAPENDTQGALASAKGNNLPVSSLVIAVAHICCETPEALLQLAGGVRVLYSYCIGEDGKLHPQRLF